MLYLIVKVFWLYLLPVRRRTFFTKKVKKEFFIKSTFNGGIAKTFNIYHALYSIMALSWFLCIAVLRFW